MTTIASYLDTVGFGLVSDSKLVPDLWHFLDLVKEEFQQLKDWLAYSSAPEPEATAVKEQPAESADQPASS